MPMRKIVVAVEPATYADLETMLRESGEKSMAALLRSILREVARDEK